MAEPLRHRQTKGAATDMFGLPPPRYISTLPILRIVDHELSALQGRSLRFAGSPTKCRADQTGPWRGEQNAGEPLRKVSVVRV